MGRHSAARHRKPGPATTPLTGALSTVKGCLRSASKRTAVAATASGIVLLTTLPGMAVADEAPQHTTGVNAGSITAEPIAAPVTVAESATFDLAAPAIEIKEKPKPVAAANSSSAVAASHAYDGHAYPQAANGNSVLAIANTLLGSPYKWAGSTPAGFDCSGFVAYVYAQMGISLPHSSYGILNAGRVVSAAEAQPGDLVYWPGHIGIYAGGNTMIDSLDYGTVVHYHSFHREVTFVRVIG